MKNKTEDNLGTASLVLGIIGVSFIFMFPPIGLILSILALVFSSKQKKIEETSYSKTGFILGLIGIILNIAIMLIVAIIVLGIIAGLSAAMV